MTSGAHAASTQHAARRRRPRWRFLEALPFLLPALAFYVTFVVYPMATAVQLSLYEWNGLSGSPAAFVGFGNYDSIFTKDPVFWTAFRNSLVWVALSLVFPTVLGLALALALNRALFGRHVFRAVFYIPAVVAAIAVATMWRWIYNPQFGIVNQALTFLGMGDLAHNWLGDKNTALAAIFIASVWQVVGANMVLFLAGLQSVPQDQVDSARVDGAGSASVFRHVILPALRPTILIVLVLTVVNSLKVFDLIVGMTGGGPAQSTQVLALWSYSLSFGSHVFGDGNAVATILLGLTMLIVIPYFVWLLRHEDSQ